MSVLAACLLALPILALSGGGGMRVPLEADRWGRVFVQVHVGSAGPYRFLIDTGSTLSAVSRVVASRLRLTDAGPMVTQSLGRRGLARLVEVTHLRIARLTIPLQRMIVVDAQLDQSGALDGVIGQDVLGRLDYLIAPGAGTMWIDPGARLVRLLDGARLPLRGAFAPLAVVDPWRHAEWGIDSGASHAVIFRAGIAARTGVHVEAATSAGPQHVERLRSASIELGGLPFSWVDAVLQPRSDRPEIGLLPLAMFDAIYVSNRYRHAVLVPRRSGKPRGPDVAACLGALEDDVAAVGRPGWVANEATRGPELCELPHLPGAGRD